MFLSQQQTTDHHSRAEAKWNDLSASGPVGLIFPELVSCLTLFLNQSSMLYKHQDAAKAFKFLGTSHCVFSCNVTIIIFIWRGKTERSRATSSDRIINGILVFAVCLFVLRPSVINMSCYAVRHWCAGNMGSIAQVIICPQQEEAWMLGGDSLSRTLTQITFKNPDSLPRKKNEKVRTMGLIVSLWF